MNQAEWVKTHIDSRGVAYVTLNRPELHNAFNEDMIREITDVFEELDQDENIRLVVFNGEGKSFCAGADLHWMKKMKNYSQTENLQDSQRLNKMFATLFHFSRPIVGKIGGHALGGGAGLTAVCDFVVAVEKAEFGFTEVRLGLVPAVISPYVISKIGESFARAYFTSGMRFSAQKAYQMGLVHELATDQEHLNQVVENIVQQYLKSGPQAVKVIKKLVGSVVPMLSQRDENKNWNKLTELTCQTISQVRVQAEAQEGMNSLLEKRNPFWAKVTE